MKCGHCFYTYYWSSFDKCLAPMLNLIFACPVVYERFRRAVKASVGAESVATHRIWQYGEEAGRGGLWRRASWPSGASLEFTRM